MNVKVIFRLEIKNLTAEFTLPRVPLIGWVVIDPFDESSKQRFIATSVELDPHSCIFFVKLRKVI